MANNLKKTSGGVFMGNPITYSVTAEAEPTTSAIAFHQVKVEVKINGKTYPFSKPVGSSETVEFDVSSAFKAAADRYEFEPVTSEIVFPIYNATITARDVWMKDGILIDPAPVGGSQPSVSCSAFMGKYSDFERLSPTQSLTFSRKPQSGDLVCKDDNVVYAKGGAVPVSAIASITASPGTTVTLPNGRKVFVTESSNNSAIFQFVNSRGVVESIRAWQLKTDKVKTSIEEYTISQIEMFNKLARLYAVKSNVQDEYYYSSGYVTLEWAMWWLYEFGQSTTYWILHSGKWIPCRVSVDETATLIDKANNSMCYVSFTCKPNINGGLF